MAQKSVRWPPYVRVAPWLLIVGGLVWNSLDPSDYWGDPLLAAAAVLSGALLTLRDTVAVGVANVTGILVLSLRDGSLGTQDGYLELVNTAFAAVLGVGVNLVVARHGRRLARVRSVAEAAQRAVLPEPPRWVAGLEVAACYRAAQDEALIGGDAYALQDTPYGVRVLIADGRGKGLHAVGAVSVLLGAFREDAHREPDLAIRCSIAWLTSRTWPRSRTRWSARWPGRAPRWARNCDWRGSSRRCWWSSRRGRRSPAPWTAATRGRTCWATAGRR